MVKSEHGAKGTLVVTYLPFQRTDWELESAIREFIPIEIVIESIQVRTSNFRQSATAFIKLKETNLATEVVNLLDRVVILGNVVRAKLYSTQLSTKSGFEAHQLDRQESTTNNNNYHQLSTMEYSQSDEIISPVLKLANLPSKPISDLPTEDFNRLAKLHVASFPIEMSDESIESQLIPLIKTHFNSERSKIKIVTAAREEYKIIFLEVFTLVKERDLNFILKNLSNEFFTFNNFNFTATFVVQKDSNWNNKVLHCDINSDDRIMNSLGKAESIVNFNNSKAGKNTRRRIQKPSSSRRNRSRSPRRDRSRSRSPRREINSSRLSPHLSTIDDPNESIRIYISKFPIKMSTQEIKSQLIKILKEIFNSEIILLEFRLVSIKSSYLSLFIKILINHSISFSSNISIDRLLKNLSKEIFKGPEGDFKVRFALEKTKLDRSSRTKDTMREGRLKEEEDDSISRNSYSSRSTRQDKDRDRDRSRSPRRITSSKRRRSIATSRTSPRLPPVSRQPRSVVRETSLDPFDLVSTSASTSTTTTSLDFLDFIISTSNPSSSNSLHLHPIINPPNTNSTINPTNSNDTTTLNGFKREIKTEILLGYLNPREASLAFLSTAGPSSFSKKDDDNDDDRLQIRYEEFLCSQFLSGVGEGGKEGGEKEKGKEWYYRILEKLSEFNELNERFSEITRLITSADGGGGGGGGGGGEINFQFFRYVFRVVVL